jgi:tRNA1Val (adenine37-N6)-methyltransferase
MKQFTYSYDQPDEYHFSLDSIEMPLQVSQHLRKYHSDLPSLKVLDLCAGCGVVGFEFHFHLPEVAQIDFLEVQDVYQSYFESNLGKVKAGIRRDSLTQFQFFNLNYNQLMGSALEGQYDVVLCNPPYFEKDQGLLSPSDFKNRCRFYLDSDFSTLVESMLSSLKPGGASFFLLRPLSEHKKNLLKSLESLVSGRADLQMLVPIRGTSLIRMQKI